MCARPLSGAPLLVGVRSHWLVRGGTHGAMLCAGTDERAAGAEARPVQV